METKSKNIFLLSTDKPSRLSFDFDENQYYLQEEPSFWEHQDLVENRNIYITNSEKFKKDEYITDGIKVIKATPKVVDAQGLVNRRKWNKIILTDNKDLIKDGVQPLPEDFLQWFIKNPSCEFVEVEKYHGVKTAIVEISAVSGNDDYNWKGKGDFRDYKIIIPSKHFTGGEKRHHKDCFYYPESFSKMYDDLKEQNEKLYSEKDIKQFAFECVAKFLSNDANEIEMALLEVIMGRNDKQFKQFKKK